MGWVYGIRSGAFVKVGVAVDLRARMQTYRLHNPHQLRWVLKQQAEAPFWIEARMHRLLADFAIGREWFRCANIDVKEAFVVASGEWPIHRDAVARARLEAEKLAVDKGPGAGTERGIEQLV